MKRPTILDALASYRPADPHETEMVRLTREFVESHEDCFERSQAAGHITGSAWIVDLDRVYVLLTHHLKLGKWLQLGGHADGDPDVLAVALREAREESGLEEIRPVSKGIFDVDVHRIPPRGDEKEHFHFDVRYLLEADRKHPLRMTPESRGLAWVRLGEVESLTNEESVLRMVRKTFLLRR